MLAGPPSLFPATSRKLIRPSVSIVAISSTVPGLDPGGYTGRTSLTFVGGRMHPPWPDAAHGSTLSRSLTRAFGYSFTSGRVSAALLTVIVSSIDPIRIVAL